MATKENINWKRINKGDILPCQSFLRKKDGEILKLSTVGGVKVGQDCYYLPVDEVINVIKGYPVEESEDEKIRKAIYNCVKWFGFDSSFFEDVSQEECLAWLEKQGQTFTKKDVDDAYLKGICDAKQELEKQEEQKPADKVKPKFHEGDWIINSQGTLRHIINVDKGGYQTDGGWLTHDTYEKTFHLWTIQDAKDGDVLLSPSTPAGDKECPFIFKEIDKNGIVRFHVALLQSEHFKIANGITNVMGYANAGYHIPANKKQRDLLFQKMHEAGYEWDSEKKELKKIGQKPAWSEEDESKRICACKFLDDAKHEINYAVNHKDDIDECITWLKSLKDRYTWKPSDEQMEAMQKALVDLCGKDEHNIITGLYYDLKKLREE